MPNSELANRKYIVPDEYLALAHGNKKLSYSNTKKIKSELDGKNKKNEKEIAFLKWLTTELTDDRNSIDAKKRIKMETGATGEKKGFNNFKDTHTKDKKNKNATEISAIPDLSHLTEGALKTEIDKSIYLIEYMENKKIKK